ncbi:MAG TPA: hypothetical protein VMV92_43635 [Streptosporangiaceae bacterium]|nr:hypothetical protein [Streptosporangiaceae bacterium]
MGVTLVLPDIPADLAAAIVVSGAAMAVLGLFVLASAPDALIGGAGVLAYGQEEHSTVE